jgi:hypothetical protein
MIGLGWATLYNTIVESFQKKTNIKKETKPQSYSSSSVSSE